MNVVLVDDERLARAELARLLEDHNTVKIVGQAANAHEAKQMVEEHQPDLLFLDIQMPEKNGFDLLEELDYVPEVIFTTAYDEYAIQAFEVNALHYLMKPIDAEKLENALRKASTNLSRSPYAGGGSTDEDGNRRLTNEDRVFVKDGERCWFVPLKDIGLMESEGNYVKLHFQGQKPLIHKSLNALEGRLDPDEFFRANRRQLINLRWVEHIEPWFSGSLRVTLKEGNQVEVSRRQSALFRDRLSI